LKFVGYTFGIHWKSIGGSFEMQVTYILNPLKSIGNTLEINSNPLEIDTKASRHRFCIQKARTPPMGGRGGGGPKKRNNLLPPTNKTKTTKKTQKKKKTKKTKPYLKILSKNFCKTKKTKKQSFHRHAGGKESRESFSFPEKLWFLGFFWVLPRFLLSIFKCGLVFLVFLGFTEVLVRLMGAGE